MKTLKSLLLGSSVALVAATGAQAADLIAEPAADYVKVCDAFGTGFYYIPGTETCLRISGNVRFFMFFDNSDMFSTADNGGTTNAVNDNEFEYNMESLFRVRFDARTQTELGTLRGFTEFQIGFGGSINQGDNAVGARHAFVQLGGLTAGQTTSFYNIVGHPTMWGGIGAESRRRNFIGYTYSAGNGISAQVALEDSNNTASGTTEFDDNAPSLVGTLRVSQSWGMVGVAAAVVDNETGDTGFAIRGAAQIKAGSNGNFIVSAIYSEDADAYSRSSSAGMNEVLQLWATYEHKFSSKFSGLIGAAYQDVDNGVTSTDTFELTGNLIYSPVSGVDFGLEVYYRDIDDGNDGNDGFAGLFRINRSF